MTKDNNAKRRFVDVLLLVVVARCSSAFNQHLGGIPPLHAHPTPIHFDFLIVLDVCIHRETIYDTFFLLLFDFLILYIYGIYVQYIASIDCVTPLCCAFI